MVNHSGQMYKTLARKSNNPLSNLFHCRIIYLAECLVNFRVSPVVYLHSILDSFTDAVPIKSCEVTPNGFRRFQIHMDNLSKLSDFIETTYLFMIFHYRMKSHKLRNDTVSFAPSLVGVKQSIRFFPLNKLAAVTIGRSDIKVLAFFEYASELRILCDIAFHDNIDTSNFFALI